MRVRQRVVGRTSNIKVRRSPRRGVRQSRDVEGSGVSLEARKRSQSAARARRNKSTGAGSVTSGETTVHKGRGHKAKRPVVGCPKHKKYTGERAPRVKCWHCEVLYTEKQKAKREILAYATRQREEKGTGICTSHGACPCYHHQLALLRIGFKRTMTELRIVSRKLVGAEKTFALKQADQLESYVPEVDRG